MNTEAFEIHVFAPGSLGNLGYTAESSWAVLQNADLSKSVFVIVEGDIVSYDWAHQTLKLKHELLERYKSDYVNFLADFSPFIVTLGGRPVLGGVVLMQFSPMAIKYPVLYVLQGPTYPETDELAIALRPTHDFRANLDAPSRFPGDDPVLTERVHQRLKSIGKTNE